MEWANGSAAVSIVVDAAVANSKWWLNGQPLLDGAVKTDGYLPTVLRLDRLDDEYEDEHEDEHDGQQQQRRQQRQQRRSSSSSSSSRTLQFGTNGPSNVLTVWTDNTATTGWWCVVVVVV